MDNLEDSIHGYRLRYREMVDIPTGDVLGIDFYWDRSRVFYEGLEQSHGISYVGMREIQKKQGLVMGLDNEEEFLKYCERHFKDISYYN